MACLDGDILGVSQIIVTSILNISKSNLDISSKQKSIMVLLSKFLFAASVSAKKIPISPNALAPKIASAI